jgi:hypothetical protein
VIFGIAALIGSVVYVSHPVQVAQQSASVRDSNPQSLSSNPPPKATFVARITKMSDCKWSDPTSTTRRTADVSLGDKIALASGLMEITYDTGAKVILQGPVTYEVESGNGGFLSVGKLMARVEKKAEGGGRRAEVSNPQSLIPNPLFYVRTPTVTVNDLGTEFGVEQSNDRGTEVFVFRGQVDMIPQLSNGVTDGQKGGTRRLTAGQGLLVKPSGKTINMNSTGRQHFASLCNLPHRKTTQSLPVVLLNDTFDNLENSASKTYKGLKDPWGLNGGPASRQRGRMAPVWYLRGGQFARNAFFAQVPVDHPELSKSLCLFADDDVQAGWLKIDRLFPPDIEVTVVVDPVFYRNAGGIRPAHVKGDVKSSNWFALSVRGQGENADDGSFPLNGNAGAALLIRSNGGWDYIENGIRIANGQVPATDWYRIQMRVIGDQLEVRINDNAINLDPMRPSVPWTLRGEAANSTHNFLTFGVSNSRDPSDPTGREVSVVKSLTIVTADNKSQKDH